jgi:hypothetical protein
MVGMITDVPLSDTITLRFKTTKTSTTCFCDAIGYEKLIAYHNVDKATLKVLHESVRHLFDQYVEDARRYI